MIETDEGSCLSVNEAAAHLGVAGVTLRKWLRERRLPYFRLGRRVVVSRRDIEAFLASHRVEACEPQHGA